MKNYACRGFTLIELLITISITTILISLSVPAFSQLQMRSQKVSGIEQMVSLITLTRSSAATSRHVAGLCGSPDGISCVKTSPKFFLVFIDRNNNHKPDANEVIRKEMIDTNYLHYQLSPSNLNSFRIRPDGLALSYGNIVICPAQGTSRDGAILFLSDMARIRHGRDRNGDGIVENRDGKPIVCP